VLEVGHGRRADDNGVVTSLSSFEWCTNQRRAAEMASISNWAHTLEAMREDQRLADFISALRAKQRGDLKLGWQLEVLHGNELPHGAVGEIVVGGPNVMKGYWNHPEETKEAFFGEWFRTGDLGTENDDGYFCIVDRKKDMTIVNSMNVYRRMVEEILYQHPAAREAAVVGEPDEPHGRDPRRLRRT
jgi:acyl-CoA synthetase (AMP-forming)/AMP-acid ligase II